MKRNKMRAFAVIGALGAVAAAQADLVFSGIVVGGSLSGGNTVTTSPIDIDVSFPSATVGDPTDPTRAGTITIDFDVTATSPLASDSVLISVLGALSGSGLITFSETVTDITDPGNPVVIGQRDVVLDDNAQLPWNSTLTFDYASANLHVSKTLLLDAPDTAGLDLANVSLVEQTFTEVPEPASLGLVLFGALVGLRRKS